MGWIFCDKSRKSLISELVRPWTSTVGRFGETLKATVRGNILWAVHRTTSNVGDDVRVYIVCYLLKKDGPLWGYKSIGEADGPFYYTCPLSYLDLAPIRNPAWRAGVRRYHCDRGNKIGRAEANHNANETHGLRLQYKMRTGLDWHEPKFPRIAVG